MEQARKLLISSSGPNPTRVSRSANVMVTGSLQAPVSTNMLMSEEALE